MSTYNGEKFVLPQVESILAQKDVDVTLNIYDDVSKDNTLEVLKKIEKEHKNVHVFLNEKNKNYTYNFMDALFTFKDNEDYDYYAFSDQDDVWVEDKLITAINHIKEKGECTLYCSNLSVVDQELNPTGRTFRDMERKYTHHDQIFACTTTGCTSVFDNAFKNLLTRQYPEKLLYHDYWIGLVANYCKQANYILDVDPSHILYRQHNSQASGGAPKQSFFSKVKNYLRGETNFHILQLLLKYYGEDLIEEDKIIIEKFLDYKKLKNKFYLLKNVKKSHGTRFKVKLLLNRFVPDKQGRDNI